MLRDTYTFPFVPSASGSVTGHHCEEPEPVFCTLPSESMVPMVHDDNMLLVALYSWVQ